MSYGERHYRARLSAADVELIRSAAEQRRWHLSEARKLSQAALADKFDTTKSNIGRIEYFQTRRRG
jgi:hypothetical protein